MNGCTRQGGRGAGYARVLAKAVDDVESFIDAIKLWE